MMQRILSVRRIITIALVCSPLEDLLSSNGLKTVGLSTAVCDVNHIKKSRYSGQVLASVLNTLLVDALKEEMSGGDPMKDFETWTT